MRRWLGCSAPRLSVARIGLSFCVPLWLFLLFCVLESSEARAQAPFLRGDVNADGQVSMADAGLWGCILFCAGPPYSCLDSADVNDDGLLGVDDLAVFLSHLFSDKPIQSGIAAPFPAVGPDPTPDGLTCEVYAPSPPSEGDDRIDLGSIRAASGEQVLVPVYLTTALEANTVQLVVRYDPRAFAPLLEGTDEEKAELYLGGTDVEPSRPGMGFVSWRADTAVGILRVGQGIDLIRDGSIGPGELIHVGNIPGTVLPDAGLGSSTELRLVEQVASEGTFRSEVSIGGTARIVSKGRPGSILVVEGFLRGDANLDLGLDISDPIHILAGLFTGTVTIECADAADADDDGAVNISDAVSLLAHLFLGAPPPRPPYPACGADSTEDQLACPAHPSCR